MKAILVVDDDEMNLKMARFILEKNGYEVIAASSGMECLKSLENKPLDLILLDVEMPVMDGIETLERIREREEYGKIPVMFLSADASEEMIASAKRLGAVGYVEKPYMPQELLQRVEQVFE